MTMSQILKQTKKCCVKIIRKFSFQPGSSSGSGSTSSPSCSTAVTAKSSKGSGPTSGRSILLNNRATSKYQLHRNCTPTRCKVQPSSPERFGSGVGESWTSGVEEEPSVRRRLEPTSAVNESTIPATQNNYRVTRDGKNLPRKRTNISSNKNVNLKKCFRLRGGPGGGFKDMVADGAGMNNSSVVTSKLDKISKTLYHVAGGSGVVETSDGKLCGGSVVNTNNLASQTSEKSKISKPLFLSGKHKKYNQIETQFGPGEEEDDEDDEFMACEFDGFRSHSSHQESGGRLQFELSQPMPEVQTTPRMERRSINLEEIVFEKVKFDRNKRYLRNETSSPSTASNRSQNGSYVASHSADSILSFSFEYNSDHPLAQVVTSKSEDFIDPWRNYNLNNRLNKVSKNPWDSYPQKCESPTNTLPSPLQRPSWNPFIDEMASSPTSSPVNQPQQQNKTYPPPYQVRTDIWQNLNNKNYEIDSDVIWRTSNSSRRTSASTVETWIEDEVFDNSFNEELERRCATLKI
ncbi:uncharacterized protein LOC129755420 [Uranotaenia lowii]|uniref:uncharacterized protein LOC129755420 n=1 Tax=Uranotaenia lowii TaxID=190385 RepID=UPI00247A9E77|nr:uncharacterized protein LOC129755420 [Uranotaenia lowii]XP_055607883.1 uncharacterized protein LOC129755420 [Uranotaenia lowii]